MRVLLPSYWWKRAFGAVIDKVEEKVEKDELKTVNGESILGEGDLKIGVKSVESVEELSALDAEVGDIATVGSESLSLVSAADLRQIVNTNEVLEKWDSFTRIGKIEFGEPFSETNRHASLWLSGKIEYPYDVIVVGCKDGEFTCFHSTGIKELTIDSVNDKLKERDYRLILSSDADVIDRTYKLYAYSASADAYIKAKNWDKLAKEYTVSSEEELNRLDVPNGTIAKVAGGYVEVNSEECYLPQLENIVSEWDKLTRIRKVEELGYSGSEICNVFLSAKVNDISDFLVASYNSSTKSYEYKNADEAIVSKREFDALLLEKDYRFIGRGISGGNPVSNVFALYTDSPTADAYIKSDTWKRLLKEGDVTGGGINGANVEAVNDNGIIDDAFTYATESYVNTTFATKEEVIENELVHSSAYVDLDARLKKLESMLLTEATE